MRVRFSPPTSKITRVAQWQSSCLLNNVLQVRILSGVNYCVYKRGQSSGKTIDFDSIMRGFESLPSDKPLWWNGRHNVLRMRHLWVQVPLEVVINISQQLNRQSVCLISKRLLVRFQSRILFVNSVSLIGIAIIFEIIGYRFESYTEYVIINPYSLKGKMLYCECNDIGSIPIRDNLLKCLQF